MKYYYAISLEYGILTLKSESHRIHTITWERGLRPHGMAAGRTGKNSISRHLQISFDLRIIGVCRFSDLEAESDSCSD
ncbi:hypothetical cytosolic protein [Syntrophus aciditrophicus SB]|uniref:Hypothetical cytosolic protein n=1 Tax=Syntrophus aciditrophicus (strain SB) TaxID=56780 RepID=Q2LPZ8_SYNAS|nr:hypothetical cytosolic protein [Syntrophus aciditrophicus SB]